MHPIGLIVAVIAAMALLEGALQLHDRIRDWHRRAGSTSRRAWLYLLILIVLSGFVYLQQKPEGDLSGTNTANTGITNTTGTIPTVSATEKTAWQVALANRKDCEAIRRYILDYPDGHFVASAQAILAARRPVNMVRWASFEFPSNVVASSSMEARTSRDAACKSAQSQLLQNMADGCRDFTRDSTRYRSVVVDPPSNTSCVCEDSAFRIGDSTAGIDSVWRCTIRSTYRCRGEQLERAMTFACN